MLSRERVSKQEGTVLTEAELGKEAAALFQKHKYNFVLASSTNLDSIMEFYHNTPAGMPFVCDFYQARLMVTAMEGIQRKGYWAEYRTAPHHPALRVLDPNHGKWESVRGRAQALYPPLDLQPITEEELERDGFVLLARKNSHPKDYTSPFEELRDTYFDRDGQIIYSMWKGYLEPEHADQHLIDFIGGRPIEPLHTSGHAYVETIVQLIKTVDPKVVVPMHTERAEEFSSIPEFAPLQGSGKGPERRRGSAIGQAIIEQDRRTKTLVLSIPTMRQYACLNCGARCAILALNTGGDERKGEKYGQKMGQEQGYPDWRYFL